MQQLSKGISLNVDLGTAIGMTGILIGATAFSMSRLTATVSEGDTPTMSNAFWSPSVVFFSAISILASLALAARMIAVFYPSNQHDWLATSNVLFKASVLIVTHWVLSWSPCFLIAMGMGNFLASYIWKMPAYFIGLVFGVAATGLIWLLITPLRATTQSISSDLKNIYSLRGLALTAVLLFIGAQVLETCYRFDLTTVKTQYSATDNLELRVMLSGRILEHYRLHIEIAPISPQVKRSCEVLKMVKEGDGGYVLWKNLRDFQSGIYRATAYFEGYSKPAFFQRFYYWKKNNFEKRTLLFMVE